MRITQHESDQSLFWEAVECLEVDSNSLFSGHRVMFVNRSGMTAEVGWWEVSTPSLLGFRKACFQKFMITIQTT